MARSPAGRFVRAIRRWRRWRGWLTAALLAACVDGPTNPGLFGELRIRPSYADGDAPAALGLSVDSANVRVVRQSEPTIALIDTTVRYESDTASMGWVLSLQSEEETLVVDVAIWDDNRQVYSGEHQVLVRESPIAEPGAEPVLVAYVGPAIVKTVIVTPESVTLDAFNATATYAATALDRHGQVVSTAFEWTSADPGVATVDASTGVVTASGNGSTSIRAAAGSASGSATVIVAQRVATIDVTPASPTLTALGATLGLQATVRDANGFTMTGAAITWSSSNDDIVTVDETGTVTAVSGGLSTITASSGGVQGSAVVTVNPVANVASVTVSPVSAALNAIGATKQFVAQARDAAGNALSGVQFVWTSNADNVATIDAAGLATAAGHGSTTITATVGSLMGTATLSVDLTTTVAQIIVAPAAVKLTSVGATQPFSAEARDPSGAVVPGVAFAWSTGNQSVGTIDPITGLATAVGHGSTPVIATVGTVQGSATLDVDLTTLVTSIVVTPATVTLTALGGTQQFTALARDANGAALPGVTFEWVSSAPGVATIEAASGVATAAGHGNTTITATANGVSGTATLNADLDQTVTSVTVSPSGAALTALGATQQFTAVARDANNAIVSGVTFTWSSEDEAVAIVDATTGIATAVGHGSVDVVAAIGDVQGRATLSVQLDDQTVTITVTPANVTLTSLGATQQFTAVARDANGTPLPGVEFEWASSAAGVASIDASTGLATVTGDGSTMITASVNGHAGTASLTANLEAAVTSIVVSPANARMTTPGATTQFTAVARDVNNSVVPGVTFTWSSSDPSVVTVDGSSGLATAMGHGSTTIIAAIGEVQGVAMLDVDFTHLTATVTVAPSSVVLTTLGATQQFTATARDANGTVIPGVPFAWTSSDAGVATVGETSGFATVRGHGTTTITAAIGDVQGTASLSVDLTSSIASIVVSPYVAKLYSLGVTQQFGAEARDALGAAIPGISFAWSSSATDVATIDAGTGLATTAGNGTTSIRATAGDVSGSAQLTVHQRVVRVEVTPNPATVVIWEFTQLTATAFDANDHVVMGRSVSWLSSDDDIAHVDGAGRVEGVARGTVTIKAFVDDIRGTASVSVECAAPTARTSGLASIIVC